MREICTSGSTRGEWVVLTLSIAHSPTLPASAVKRLPATNRPVFSLNVTSDDWSRPADQNPNREPQPTHNMCYGICGAYTLEWHSRPCPDKIGQDDHSTAIDYFIAQALGECFNSHFLGRCHAELHHHRQHRAQSLGKNLPAG